VRDKASILSMKSNLPRYAGVESESAIIKLDGYLETCWLAIFNARCVDTDLDLRLEELRGDPAGTVASKKGSRKRDATMQYMTRPLNSNGDMVTISSNSLIHRSPRD
jgi:hypothetical protein